MNRDKPVDVVMVEEATVGLYHKLDLGLGARSFLLTTTEPHTLCNASRLQSTRRLTRACTPEVKYLERVPRLCISRSLSIIPLWSYHR